MQNSIKIDFPSNNDVELCINSDKRECSYHIFNPKEGNPVLVFIPGCGADLGEYSAKLCSKITNNFNITVLYVEYFAYSSRLSSGASIEFSNVDLIKINNIIVSAGLKPEDNITANIKNLSNRAKQLNKNIFIDGYLKPKNKEYQNFGLMPALDILNAIRDAISRFDLDTNSITLMGSSYGGYLANMVSKIAPGYIRLVMDNSAWATPNLAYIVGKELNQPEFQCAVAEHVIANLWTLSPWTSCPDLPNTYSNHNHEIRSFSKSQLMQMSSHGATETSYIFYHSNNDHIAPAEEKINMVKHMISLGFKYIQMEVMTDENDIDGIFIKNLDHGMGMSLYSFFEKHYEKSMNDTQGFKCKNNSIVSYSCGDVIYVFDFSSRPVNFNINYI